jgi:glycosyltransferase involved in cell wall biosynthesis
VLPSRYEPFGTVILEAWATATPLIACSSAGPAAYIHNEINGMLTPIDDAASLAKAIRDVIGNDALRQKIVTQGYEDYRAHYTREAVTQQWIEYYRGLMKADML